MKNSLHYLHITFSYHRLKKENACHPLQISLENTAVCVNFEKAKKSFNIW